MSSVAVAVLLGLTLFGPAAPTALAERLTAVDNDPENQLWDCTARRVPFGDTSEDMLRCFTFRFAVPAGGVTSAFVHLATTTGGLQETDALVLATAQPIPDCDSLRGLMAGCVILHGGLEEGQVAINLNLLDIACNPSIQGSPEKQQAVLSQLNTGVLHFLLQDDTAVLATELVINEGPASIPCGASTEPINPATGTSIGGTGGNQIPGAGSNVPGNLLPTPPFGSPEPPPGLSGMTILAGQRTVVEGQSVWVPIWIINGVNVANINFEILYDGNVAVAVPEFQRGTFLENSLGSGNSEQPNRALVGHAQTSGEDGTGVITWIEFEARGRPGDRTPLTVVVTTINDPDGTVLSIDRVDGLIQIADANGLIPGDCNGDGRLDLDDALCALQMSVQLIPEQLTLDIDVDSRVTSRDSTIILQRAFGN